MNFSVGSPVVADLISATPALVIAAVVAWIAYQQLSTAKNKLAMDLFDRRYAAWSRLMTAFDSYVAAVDEGRLRSCDAEADVFSPESLALIEAERSTTFLFGRDFRSKLDVLIDLVFDYRNTGTEPEEARFNQQSLNRTRTELTTLAEKYMMLGHIGISKPTKR